MIDKARVDAVIESFSSDQSPHEAHQAGDECPICTMCDALNQSNLKDVVLRNLLSKLHPLGPVLGADVLIGEALVLGFILGSAYKDSEYMETLIK
jgi:hypothetical protein